jgi:hypothetical protein
MIGLRGNKKVAAFFQKSGAKNFCLAGPEALQRHGPKVKKVFLLLLVHKKKPSSSLEHDLS